MKQLGFKETEKLLEKYKLPVPKQVEVITLEEAKFVAKKIKYPIVLKIISETILHKSDVDGVKVGIENEQELTKAFKKLKKIKKVNSYMVQKYIEGQFVIVGMKRDEQFGPTVLVGAGGIYVEILKDAAMRIAPITLKEAKEMIKELKIYPILTGARKQEKVNLDALAKIILKVSQIGMKEDIKEMDFNPVVLNKKEGVIVDARIIK